jgi:hypothetical protein
MIDFPDCDRSAVPARAATVVGFSIPPKTNHSGIEETERVQ